MDLLMLLCCLLCKCYNLRRVWWCKSVAQLNPGLFVGLVALADCSGTNRLQLLELYLPETPLHSRRALGWVVLEAAPVRKLGSGLFFRSWLQSAATAASASVQALAEVMGAYKNKSDAQKCCWQRSRKWHKKGSGTGGQWTHSCSCFHREQGRLIVKRFLSKWSRLVWIGAMVLWMSHQSADMVSSSNHSYTIQSRILS